MSQADPEAAARTAGPEAAGVPGRAACRPEIVLAYAIIGLAIVLAAGLTTKVYRVPLTAQFGLFQLLPPAYWVGLGLIALAAAIAVWTRSDWLVALTGVVLLATLAGTPTLFEPTPRYWDSYMHFGEAQILQSSGRLPPNPLSYAANWPGAFLVLATLAGAGRLDPIEFLGLYPFLAGGVTFLAIFELLRSTFDETIARQASVPTALFAVWAQYHVSPQSIGFVLFLLILSTVRRRETKWRAVTVIAFVGLVASHPTSAILLLTILVTFATLTLIPWFRDRAPREVVRLDSRFSSRVAITFATVWLAWLFFLAVGSAEAAQVAIVTRMNTILGIPEQTISLWSHRTSENLLTWAPLIRTGSIGIFGLFGLVSLLVLFRHRSSRGQFRFAISVMIAPVLVAFADIFAFSGQFYDRSILLLSVIVPALCFTGVHRLHLPRPAKAVVLGLLVGASVATASTAYYLEAFTIVPVEAIAGSDFIYRLPDGSLVLDGMYPSPVWLDPAQRPLLTRFAFPQIYPTPLESWDPGMPMYAVLDPTTELWYRQWYGAEVYRFYSDARDNYSLIYDNGWTEVYSIQG